MVDANRAGVNKRVMGPIYKASDATLSELRLSVVTVPQGRARPFSPASNPGLNDAILSGLEIEDGGRGLSVV